MYLIEKGAYVHFVCAEVTAETIANINKCMAVINNMSADMAGPLPVLHSFYMSRAVIALACAADIAAGADLATIGIDTEALDKIEPQFNTRLITEDTNIAGVRDKAFMLQVNNSVAVVMGDHVYVRINRVGFFPEDVVKPMYGRKVKAEQFVEMLNAAGVVYYTIEKF